uniref:Uncharacterized protein n=1 Tax=Cannabis sativa TaxID=3483 RepID=A0A803PTE3_CANSA
MKKQKTRVRGLCSKGRGWVCVQSQGWDLGLRPSLGSSLGSRSVVWGWSPGPRLGSGSGPESGSKAEVGAWV